MIAIGMGANSVAPREAFSAALEVACRDAGGCDVVATLATTTFAAFVEAAALQASTPYRPLMLIALRDRSGDCLTRSERSLSLFGVASIAEAAALVGAGPGSRLVMPRRIVGNITVAAAQSAVRGKRSK